MGVLHALYNEISAEQIKEMREALTKAWAEGEKAFKEVSSYYGYRYLHVDEAYDIQKAIEKEIKG